jgi:hypothetical protein
VLLRECRRHRERGQQDEKGGAAETDHLFVPYEPEVHAHRPAKVPERWLAAAPFRKIE